MWDSRFERGRRSRSMEGTNRTPDVTEAFGLPSINPVGQSLLCLVQASLPLEEHDLTAPTSEPAAPTASDEAAVRVGKFLFTIAQTEEPPNDDVRVRALTAWLRATWESDKREEARVDVCISA